MQHRRPGCDAVLFLRKMVHTAGLPSRTFLNRLGTRFLSFRKKDDVNLPEGKAIMGGKKEKEDEFNSKSESLGIYEIGTVVSLSRSIDSVVFKFLDDIEVKPPLTVKVASGLKRVIQLPNVNVESKSWAHLHPSYYWERLLLALVLVVVDFMLPWVPVFLRRAKRVLWLLSRQEASASASASPVKKWKRRGHV